MNLMTRHIHVGQLRSFSAHLKLCRIPSTWLVFASISLFLIGLAGRKVVFAQEVDPLSQLKSVHSELYGAEVVELNIDGAMAFVVKPTGQATTGPKPWVWYAPSLRGNDGTWELPSKRHADVMKSLLAAGFHFCGVDVGESYGSPDGRKTFTAFHRRLVDQYGFSPKACLFAVSRGGLMHYTWAVEHPECVQYYD